jgi:hypothetical protein
MGRQPSHRNSITATTIARPMPGIAPSTATPSRQPMDSQNSQRWMRQMRRRSDLEQANGRGDDHRRQRAGHGQVVQQAGRHSSSAATASAPTTPVSWVLAPAASATGVREALALMAKPWNKPAARLAAPRPTISWFGSTYAPVLAA